MSGESKEEMIGALLDVNRMSYLMSQKLSIATQRHQTTGFPQQSSYTPGRTMILDVQTGNSFLNGQQSYLRLTVEGVVALSTFGNGGVGNLFERVVCRARSGQELSRLDTANLMISMKQFYLHDLEYLNTTGSVQGILGGGLGVGIKQTFCIPMSILCPFFEQDRLLPPQVCEGLRLELTLASAADALVGAGASYLISDPQFKFDTYSIADPFVRKISEIAATSGLVLQHKELFNVIVTQPAATANLNFDIKKAASFALRSYVFARDTAEFTDAKDSIKPIDFDWTSQQCNIGNVYYPNQKLTTTGTDIGEAYMYAQTNLGRVWKPNSVTRTQFASGKSGLVYSYDKSHVNGLAGSEINNSRSLIFNLQSAVPATPRRVDCYLEHIRAVLVFSSNVVVKD
jgi:hypothetical protein